MRQNKTNKLKTIFRLVLNRIAELYLYFLAIYLLSLILSLFFEQWRLFFDWEIFHFSIVLFGILSLMSKKGREFVFSQKRLQKLVGFEKTLRPGPDFGKELLKNIPKIAYFKAAILTAVLVYVLLKGISPVNFLILGYALASVLFVIDSRIAAGIALIFLVSCPVLLILKKEPLAEMLAIYAFYFLLICVAIQIRESLKNRKDLSTD